MFGTGQAGNALAAHLAGLGMAARAMSRRMTGDLPLAAATVKGWTRAAMTGELLAAAEAGRVRLAIERASDFFGPGVARGSAPSPVAR